MEQICLFGFFIFINQTDLLFFCYEFFFGSIVLLRKLFSPGHLSRIYLSIVPLFWFFSLSFETVSLPQSRTLGKPAHLSRLSLSLFSPSLSKTLIHSPLPSGLWFPVLVFWLILLEISSTKEKPKGKQKTHKPQTAQHPKNVVFCSLLLLQFVPFSVFSLPSNDFVFLRFSGVQSKPFRLPIIYIPISGFIGIFFCTRDSSGTSPWVCFLGLRLNFQSFEGHWSLVTQFWKLCRFLRVYFHSFVLLFIEKKSKKSGW